MVNVSLSTGISTWAMTANVSRPPPVTSRVRRSIPSVLELPGSLRTPARAA